MTGTMATGGGLVHTPADANGPGRLHCPVVGCSWFAEVTDLGEFVHVGMSEDDVRTHLGRHTVEEWLRTVASARDEVQRAWGRAAAEAQGHRVRECCAIEAAHLGGATRAQAVRIVALAEERHDVHH